RNGAHQGSGVLPTRTWASQYVRRAASEYPKMLTLIKVAMRPMMKTAGRSIIQYCSYWNMPGLSSSDFIVQPNDRASAARARRGCSLGAEAWTAQCRGCRDHASAPGSAACFVGRH